MTANTYAYTGPGTRWSEEDPTAEDYLNVARINVDHVHETINEYTDSDNPDLGLFMRVGAAMKIRVDASTTWSLGWWQSTDTRWWLLGDTSGADIFTRADAEFYIPTGSVSDVPTS